MSVVIGPSADRAYRDGCLRVANNWSVMGPQMVHNSSMPQVRTAEREAGQRQPGAMLVFFNTRAVLEVRANVDTQQRRRSAPSIRRALQRSILEV